MTLHIPPRTCSQFHPDEQPDFYFHRVPGRRSGSVWTRVLCRKCRKIRDARRRFGITQADPYKGEPNIPEPPCNEPCKFHDLCKAKRLACRAFVQYADEGQWTQQPHERTPTRATYLKIFEE